MFVVGWLEHSRTPEVRRRRIGYAGEVDARSEERFALQEGPTMASSASVALSWTLSHE